MKDGVMKAIKIVAIIVTVISLVDLSKFIFTKTLSKET